MKMLMNSQYICINESGLQNIKKCVVDIEMIYWTNFEAIESDICMCFCQCLTFVCVFDSA